MRLRTRSPPPAAQRTNLRRAAGSASSGQGRAHAAVDGGAQRTGSRRPLAGLARWGGRPGQGCGWGSAGRGHSWGVDDGDDFYDTRRMRHPQLSAPPPPQPGLIATSSLLSYTSLTHHPHLGSTALFDLKGLSMRFTGAAWSILRRAPLHRWLAATCGPGP
jgi:hypothetical protein